ncbi:MAG: hypothetical protein JWM44_2419 [Bacilli bacterium]|jgi:hypothetical protein|nr:hypothetical protein [Bacilli bacterium]
MELNKYQIKFELGRLKKLKNDLIDQDITTKVGELSSLLFKLRQELDEAEFERLLQTLAQEIKTAAKEMQ